VPYGKLTPKVILVKAVSLTLLSLLRSCGLGDWPFLHNIQIVRQQPTSGMGFFRSKVSASGTMKGSHPVLTQRFFQKFLGQVCLNPKSFKP